MAAKAEQLLWVRSSNKRTDDFMYIKYKLLFMHFWAVGEAFTNIKSINQDTFYTLDL